MIDVRMIAPKLQGHIGKQWSLKRKARMYSLMRQIGVEGNDFEHIQCSISKDKIIWTITVKEGTVLHSLRPYDKSTKLLSA